jgi:hypothetical protein
MNSKLTKLLFPFVFLFSTLQISAQTLEQYWKNANSISVASLKQDERDIKVQKAYIFELNLDAFKRQIFKVPLRYSNYNESSLPIINLPMPDGSVKLFRVMEAPVLHPDLQSRFPEIRSYAGYDVRSPSTTIRFDISPNGLSAMILGENGAVFIDAYSHGSTTIYQSYDKKDFTTDKQFKCENEAKGLENNNEGFLRSTGDGMMRKYRLALGATAEYSKYCGGTVAKVLAAMNKTMTRVNGLYEKEFSITMEIIPNTDKLIFFDALTDGYTNDDGVKMLKENQNKCDAIIGTSNYDIGHVFSTDGGGIANLQSPCKATSKARGVTGSPSPKGDPFDIDFVAHEMGHQFGGDHTFNNICLSDPNNPQSGNRADNASFEPGSGSTIMAYAGVCSPSVQNNSDAYFHAMSIAQISTYVTNGTGNSCGEKIATKNLNEPTVNAGADYTIPNATPFELTGIANDVETAKTDLTYCWEQYDREIATMPPTGTASSGPTFRSLNPAKSNIRIFPPIANIVKNSKNTWDVLPKVNRTMNFRLTVRDNDITGGRTNADNMRITVTSDGPFAVTHPDTAKLVWTGGQNQTVKWNVANTNGAAINTQSVMILLSSDGGYTYPDTLAKAVSNTGTATIKVPEKNIAKARIKIKGVNNIFFDISNNDFTIEKPLFPSFSLLSTNSTGKVCKEKADSIGYTIEVGSIAGFKNNVKIIAKKIPTNAKFSFSQDTITPSGKIKMTVYNLKKVDAGNYAFTVAASSNTLMDSLIFGLNLYQNLAGQVNIVRPLAYERGFGAKAPLTWRKINNAERYVIEISKNATFLPLDETANIADTQYVALSLLPIQVYYWRIRAVNPCGQSDVTAPTIFQTGTLQCDTIKDNTAVDILSSVNEITSKVEVTRKGKVSEMSVYTLIDHANMGDLTAAIENQNGSSVILFSGICVDKKNAEATFEDTGGAISCKNGTTATLRGRFKPKDALSAFNGESMKGNWTLRIKDNISGNSGALKAWNLRVCNDVAPDADFIVETDTAKTLAGEFNNISQDVLTGTSIGTSPDKISYKIITLPKNGMLKRGSSELLLGATITQQEINTGALFYTCDANTNTSRDSFVFESTTAKGGWIPSTTFYIIIKTNNIKLTTQEVKNVSCFGANDGKAVITVNGGQSPFKYSINNSTSQTTNDFNNLISGAYKVTVTDANGFNNTIKFTITEPTKLVSAVKTDSTTVNILIKGGTSPYQIDYDKKGFTKDTSFINQANGWHTYIVKDTNGCEYKDSFALKVNTLNILFDLKKPSCFGVADAIVTVDAKGGKAPFNYALNNAAFQTQNSFANLAAGTYKITVRDADSLTRSLNITITAPDVLAASAKTQRDSIVLIVKGGTAPYQYSIDNAVSFQKENIFTKIANGTYSFVVKDANGCTKNIENYQFTTTREQADALGITFMPNPAHDILQIAFRTAVEFETHLKLLNVRGQIVAEDKIPSQSSLFSLRVNHLPKGLYYIVLSNQQFETNHKILIGF